MSARRSCSRFFSSNTSCFLASHGIDSCKALSLAVSLSLSLGAWPMHASCPSPLRRFPSRLPPSSQTYRVGTNKTTFPICTFSSATLRHTLSLSLSLPLSRYTHTVTRSTHLRAVELSPVGPRLDETPPHDILGGRGEAVRVKLLRPHRRGAPIVLLVRALVLLEERQRGPKKKVWAFNGGGGGGGMSLPHELSPFASAG